MENDTGGSQSDYAEFGFIYLFIETSWTPQEGCQTHYCCPHQIQNVLQKLTVGAIEI
jgi:hypothetical protein